MWNEFAFAIFHSVPNKFSLRCISLLYRTFFISFKRRIAFLTLSQCPKITRRLSREISYFIYSLSELWYFHWVQRILRNIRINRYVVSSNVSNIVSFSETLMNRPINRGCDFVDCPLDLKSIHQPLMLLKTQHRHCYMIIFTHFLLK